MSNENLIEPMEFYKIDKISDDVYAIAQNLILKFNVSLSKVSNGKRYHFHKEYEYQSRNIDGNPNIVTIKRSFDYYLSIENLQKNNNGDKLFIRIGPQEIMLLRKAMDEVTSWFTDKKYAKLFVIDKGSLILTAPIPETGVRNLPMNKSIEFSPIVIDRNGSNADKKPGIRIMFNNESSNIIDIDLDRFMGFNYIISCFDMYQSAMIMVNYLQRPEFGTNRFVMDNSKIMPKTNETYGVRGVEGRFVAPIGVKDNINILEG